MVTRRQTLTGIRTSAIPTRLNSPTEAAKRSSIHHNKRQSPLIKTEPIYGNLQDQGQLHGLVQEPIYDNVEPVKHTKKTNEAVRTPSRTPARRANTPKGYNSLPPFFPRITIYNVHPQNDM